MNSARLQLRAFLSGARFLKTVVLVGTAGSVTPSPYKWNQVHFLSGFKWTFSSWTISFQRDVKAQRWKYPRWRPADHELWWQKRCSDVTYQLCSSSWLPENSRTYCMLTAVLFGKFFWLVICNLFLHAIAIACTVTYFQWLQQWVPCHQFWLSARHVEQKALYVCLYVCMSVWGDSSFSKTKTASTSVFAFCDIYHNWIYTSLQL